MKLRCFGENNHRNISRNENFYNGDTINKDLFNQDGVHLFEKGIGVLAQNIRRAVCRSVNKEYVNTQKKGKPKFEKRPRR